MEPVIDEPDLMGSDTGGEPTDTDRTDGEDSVATPAQSRSSSAHPAVQEEPDLFDGYSFKGRHSVLIDDDDDSVANHGDADSEGDDDEEELPESLTAPLDIDGLPSTELEEDEPKTPEQRKPALPDIPVDVPVTASDIAEVEPPVESVVEVEDQSVAEVVSSSVEATPKVDKSTLDSSEAVKPVEEKDSAPAPVSPKAATAEPVSTIVAMRPNAPTRAPRGRREKSGIPALDRDLSDADEDGLTEREDDDDWDFVEAPGVEDRNGSRGTTLFARGVVDRYRLAVFRKSLTPTATSKTQRKASGMSVDSEIQANENSSSPSPSEKHRRGRNPALTFRRNPKQFLRARSPAPPPSSFNSRSSGASRTLNHSKSATVSMGSSSGIMTPSVSTGATSVTTGPSLKTKDSTISVGSLGISDQSVNGDRNSLSQSAAELPSSSQRPKTLEQRPSRASLVDEPEKTLNQKLKKYKENAEKVLSLFSSPRT